MVRCPMSPEVRRCAAIAALILTCSAGRPADAVVGGATTTGFPGVGGFARAGAVECTGVLVDSSCVLTAAHCLELGTSGLTFFVGNSLASPTLTAGIAGAMVHPSWAGDQTHDLAVVRIDHDGVVPAMPTGSPPAAGASLTIVGFGSNGSTSGVKRTAVVSLDLLEPTFLVTDGAVANVCTGDSGGPLLENAGGVLTVVGIASATDASCSEYGVWARVDGSDAAFIQAAVQAVCNGDNGAIFSSAFEQGISDLGWSSVVPASMSCSGRCLTLDPGSECQCDDLCLLRGDCCLDLCGVCGPCE